MAKVDELSKKQEADRRAALLGLAAGKTPEKLGRCLTSLEMSEFLEGKSSPEQQQVYLAHFSSCDSCYREWLELQLELSCDTSAARKPLLLRRRVLTVAGSLLATAASVIFYLNLEQGAGPFETPPLSAPQADMELQEQLVVPSSPVPQKAMQETAPAPARKKLQRQSAAISVESMEEAEEGGAPRMDQGDASFSMSSRQAASPAMEAQEFLKHWLHQVEESCTQQQPGPDTWKMLARQGHELLPETEFPELSDLVVRLERLARGENQDLVCAEIIQLLKDTKYEW